MLYDTHPHPFCAFLSVVQHSADCMSVEKQLDFHDFYECRTTLGMQQSASVVRQSSHGFLTVVQQSSHAFLTVVQQSSSVLRIAFAECCTTLGKS